jgi:hypothetical protein
MSTIASYGHLLLVGMREAVARGRPRKRTARHRWDVGSAGADREGLQARGARPAGAISARAPARPSCRSTPRRCARGRPGPSRCGPPPAHRAPPGNRKARRLLRPVQPLGQLRRTEIDQSASLDRRIFPARCEPEPVDLSLLRVHDQRFVDMVGGVEIELLPPCRHPTRRPRPPAPRSTDTQRPGTQHRPPAVARLMDRPRTGSHARHD